MKSCAKAYLSMVIEEPSRSLSLAWPGVRYGCASGTVSFLAGGEGFERDDTFAAAPVERLAGASGRIVEVACD